MFGFSIIVPVYKVEDCLPKCMDSLLAQDYPADRLEIILVDDGSPDNCGRMCDSYASRHSNVKSLHKENGGLSDARNYGLSHASMDYVLFVDSDDYLERETCRWFNAELEKHDAPIDMCTGGILKHAGDHVLEMNTSALPPRPLSGKDYLKNRLLCGRFVAPVWASAYRRVFLEKHRLRFWKGRIHEDEDFTPRAMLAAETVASCQHPFYHYIIRENSITTAKDRSRNALDIFAIVNALHTVYSQLEDRRLAKLLMAHNAKICFRAIETCELFRKSKRHLIDKPTVGKNCVFLKEKLEYWLLCLYPPLTHFIRVIFGKAKG